MTDDGGPDIEATEMCPRCEGCGEVDDDPYGSQECMGIEEVCDLCGGTGEIPLAESRRERETK